MTEADVQRRVVKTLRYYGAEVYNLAQGYRPGGKRHATTRQTRGLPDLYVFFPRWRAAAWIEVKRRPDTWPLDGVDAETRKAFYVKQQRPEQRQFQLWCMACGVRYVLGGLEEALEICEAMKREATL